MLRVWLGVDELDITDEQDHTLDMGPQAVALPNTKGDYVLTVAVKDARTNAAVEVARARVGRSGDVSVDTVDVEGLDRSLALLAAVRFADYPISEFSRKAMGRLFESTASAQRKRGTNKDRPATRAVYDLLTELPVGKRAKARTFTLIRAHFEAVVVSYATDLIRMLEKKVNDARAEDTSGAWQPDDRLLDERDRILRYGGSSPMSASEIQRFLELSRTTLAARRQSGALLGLPLGSSRKLVYPRWQFDPSRPTHLLPGLQPALSRLARYDPWGLADLLTSGHPALDGRTPLEKLSADPSSADLVAGLLEAEYLQLPDQAASPTTRHANDTTPKESRHMAKATPKQIHVVKRPEGWGAVRAGNSRSSIEIKPTQAAAERAAKDLARRSGGAEVITHGQDGRIRSSDTIARNDPHPPIDREH
jgi:hypothetical protein